MPIPKRHYRELYELIFAIENEKEAEMLLKDLLTPNELASLAERWQEVQLLAQGVPQRGSWNQYLEDHTGIESIEIREWWIPEDA